MDGENDMFRSLMGRVVGSFIESSSMPRRVGVAEPDSLRLPAPATGGDGQDSRFSDVVVVKAPPSVENKHS